MTLQQVQKKLYRVNGAGVLRRLSPMAIVTCLIVISAACTPTVKVAAPDKPITINMNINIKHEIKVKVDKALDDLFSDEEGLF